LDGNGGCMHHGKAECVACADSRVRYLKGDLGNYDSKSPELLSTLAEAKGK
jgi:hypothetical protein